MPRRRHAESHPKVDGEVAQAQRRGSLIESGQVPRGNTLGCPDVYQRVQTNYRQFVLPYVDVSLVKASQSKKWLEPE